MVLITSPLAPARFKDRGTNNVLAPLSRLPLHSQQCPDAFFFFFFFCTHPASKWEACPAFEGRLLLLQGFIDFCKTSHLLVAENAQNRGEVADLRQGIAPFQAATPSRAERAANPSSGSKDAAGLGGSGQRNPPRLFYPGVQMPCARQNA